MKKSVNQTLLRSLETYNVIRTTSQKLKLALSLGKPNLSVFVSASAVTGLLLSSNNLDLSIPSLFTGTLLCSFSANAFNQLYEHKTDKLMNRTRFRPLPSGKLSLNQGLAFAATNAALGPLILYQGCGTTTAALGILNIALYAGVYTPLKQKTVLNTWVGSLVGAIPPLMGYAVNSDLSSLMTIEASLLPAVLFFWQFPHFFALSYLHKDDYKRGGHKMVSDTSYDPDGLKTASHIYNYAFLLSLVPIAGYLSGTFSIMLPIEGMFLNGYAIYLAEKFKRRRNRSNARRIFLTSLWYLPLLMSLMVVHKKQENGDNELLRKLRKLGKDVCVHEWFIEPSKTKEEKLFCHSQK